MYIFGSFYAITIVLLMFKREEETFNEVTQIDDSELDAEDDKERETKGDKLNLLSKLLIAYKLIWSLLKIRPIRLIALVLLTSKVIFIFFFLFFSHLKKERHLKILNMSL